MSQENVEIVRRSFEAVAAQQFDLTIEPWDANGEWVPAMAGAVEGKVYRGRAEIRRYWDDLFESFSEMRVEDPEFRDLGDRVLVLYRLLAKGRDSEVVMDQPGAILYEFRDEKIVRARSFLSQDEALEAVGLRE